MKKTGDAIETATITFWSEKPTRTSVTRYAKALALAQGANPKWLPIARMLLRSAEEGEPESIYALATWRLFGQDGILPLDYREGARLLALAGEAGVASALYDLAISNEKGLGVRKNVKRAFALYVDAALHSDPQSHEEVGRHYYWGIGIARDRRLAEIWYRRAEALLGHAIDAEE